MNDNISDAVHEILTMLECAKMKMKSNGRLYKNDLYYPFIEGITTHEESDALTESLSELIELCFNAGRNY